MSNHKPGGENKGKRPKNPWHGDSKLVINSILGIIGIIVILGIIIGSSSVFFQTGSPPPPDITTPEQPTPRPKPEFNSPPIADNQYVMTDSNIPVDIILTASDPEINDDLTAAIVSPPSNGRLSDINQNSGVVTYTPNPGFTGVDSFTFKVNDGKVDSNNVGAVSITVNEDQT